MGRQHAPLLEHRVTSAGSSRDETVRSRTILHADLDAAARRRSAPRPARTFTARCRACFAAWMGLAGVVGLVACARPTPPVRAVVSSSVEESAISIGTSYRFHSKALGEMRTVNVWMPPRGQGPYGPFPVLYVLDGGIDQDFHHVSGLAQLATIAGAFEVPIVVGIPTVRRRTELTSPPLDPRYRRPEDTYGGAAAFRSFVIDEVMPFVEARLPVAPRRILAGESLAGLFVIETLAVAPAAFTDYIAVSPSLWYDDRRLSKEVAARFGAPNRPATLLYLSMGNEGGTMQRGMDELVAGLAALPEAKVSVTVDDRRTTHAHWNIYHPVMLTALTALLPAPTPSFDPGSFWFMIEGAAPPGWTPP